MTPAKEAAEVLDLFSIDTGGKLVSFSPIDGQPIGRVTVGDPDFAATRAAEAFLQWRTLPAPRRGELVRLLGEVLREAKPLLAKMITLEAGKILQESLGEVQEMIDICDFAVGLSRQLYGLTIASERPNHRMMEQWHPLGPVVVISAFNFPVAVWAWNAALALVCGNPVIWKPSEKTPLCAEMVMQIVRRALRPTASSNSCKGSAMLARHWLMTGALPWSPRPARRRWAARSARALRSGSGAFCSSSAAITRPSSVRPRTSSSQRGRFSSRLPERRGSVARRCAG
jgi:acyl-CoA reductase-like NAD-dependent aldehyde dehydrogenase